MATATARFSATIGEGCSALREGRRAGGSGASPCLRPAPPDNARRRWRLAGRTGRARRQAPPRPAAGPRRFAPGPSCRRSWSSRRTRSPASSMRASRRESCSSMRARRAVASAGGCGAISVPTSRPRRMASAQRSVRTSSFAARGRITLIEDQINHRQHGVQPLGHVVQVGHAVRNAGVADFALGAHQPLGHRGLRDEKRPRDLVRFEAAQRPERQRDLRLRRQRRVAAREDQAKAIVGDVAGIV